MRAAQRPWPRVKACRRASDRRVTPAGQHAAGISGRRASLRPVSSWLLPGTSRGSDRRPADAHPLPSHARHRDDNDVGDRRSRDRPEARPPARRGSHATVPHSRKLSTLDDSVASSSRFCSRWDPARQTRDVVTRGPLLSFDDEHWRRRVPNLGCADTRARRAAAGRPASTGASRDDYELVRRPAVAEITGAGRPWTVSMISELSMPCR
jgi:hypothetical protein